MGMGETSKGQRAGPMNRIDPQTTSSSELRTLLKAKITKRNHFKFQTKPVHQAVTPISRQSSQKIEPISDALSTLFSSFPSVQAPLDRKSTRLNSSHGYI